MSIVAAMVRRDAAIFLSYRTRLFTIGFSSVFSLVLFHFISQLVRAPSLGGPKEYFAFVVVGLVIVQMLTSVIVLPGMTLRQELVAGTFERLATSPAGAAGSMLSLIAFPLAFAIVDGALTIVIASAFFGLDVQWSTAALAIPYGALGILAFLPFGLLVLAASLVTKQTNVGTGIVVSVISIVSGVYFPTTLLPNWLSWAPAVQPFTPAIELMRHALVGTPLTDAMGLDLARLVGAIVLLIPPGLYALRASVQFGRRRGTILEY
jgi:ABC-2 type transport system permease protein